MLLGIGGLGLFVLFFGKSSQNSPKPVLTFCSSIPCVFCLYTLLKVVGYYYMSVLSMSVMGFQTKVWMGWVGGWVGGVGGFRGELYPRCLDFLIFLNFAEPLIDNLELQKQ